MKATSRKSAQFWLIALGIIGIGLAACGGGSTVTPGNPPAASRTSMKLTYDARAVIPAPEAWSIVPGTLHAAFAPAFRAVGQAGISLRLSYPANKAAAIRAAHALVAVVAYSDGTSVHWVTPGVLDVPHRRITAELPPSLLDGATGVTLALGTDHMNYAAEPPGPRFWTGKVWNKTGTIDPNKKTVVLIHGIFSSVEESFPSPSPKAKQTACPDRIANAGGFKQVLGFDYKWNEPPYYGGDRFADFLKEIGDAGVSSVTIEAHSYGSVVALAAVPLAAKKLKVDNVVTLGGPLPLRGTPLALAKNHWRMGMVLGLMDWYFDEPPSVVDRAFDSGMVASLRPDSGDLTGIRDAINDMTTKPKFYEVAGTKWICFYSLGGVCILSEEKFRPQLIDGSDVQLPWDGVVETIAANSSALPSPVPTTFKLSHIELQCSDDVIKWVGQQLTGSQR